ncbi:hypothetical protein NDU88_007305 [Pleurodeles waltl]|uniref:Uncharacterized protein n=1 Tax=Pleurodeles waltl TaxID=8319 RepID=A0AAV7WD67_PLEWA|nr:hypothetical protein NDU88_007305 [Pleurodeles waltl]
MVEMQDLQVGHAGLQTTRNRASPALSRQTRTSLHPAAPKGAELKHGSPFGADPPCPGLRAAEPCAITNGRQAAPPSPRPAPRRPGSGASPPPVCSCLRKKLGLSGAQTSGNKCGSLDAPERKMDVPGRTPAQLWPRGEREGSLRGPNDDEWGAWASGCPAADICITVRTNPAPARSRTRIARRSSLWVKGPPPLRRD